LIHAYNPKLIGKWEDLNKLTNLERIALAMDAAEKFFGLEKYLAPDEIEILDDKSMIIYVSEYYNGLTKHGKVRTAANRIRGLIEESKVNDQLKDDYNKRAKLLRDHLESAKAQIGDGAGDGTLEGAERRMKEFYDLRDKSRGPLLQEFLSLETLYNTITMRLSDQKRPEFKCDPGCALPELRTSYNSLDRTFKELEKILLAELRRQRQIAKLNSQHEERCNKIKEWAKGKQGILGDLPEISSTGRARFFKNQLDTLNKEVESVKTTSVVDIKKLGAKLIELKYERSDAVLAREAEVDALFPALAASSDSRTAYLNDALTREEFKENVRIQELSHAEKAKALNVWLQSVLQQLAALQQGAASIEGEDAAKFSLAQLGGIREDIASQASSVHSFKELGAKVRSAEYKGSSTWSFQDGAALDAREAKIDAAYAQLPAQEAATQEALDDAQKREHAKQQAKLWERTHADNARKLKAELAELREFLEQKFETDSVQGAAWAIRQISSTASERDAKRSSLAALKILGAKVKSASYRDVWAYGGGAQIDATEAEIAGILAELDALAASKEAAFNGDLTSAQSKDQAGINWANVAQDFQRWTKDTLESVNNDNFGSTLEEVESFDIKGSDAQINGELAERQTSYRSVDAALKSSGASSTYSSTSVAELDALGAGLATALGARNGRYGEDLAKKQSDEKLCQEFAGLANPLQDKVNASKDHISNPTGALEEQLAYIKKTRAEEEPKAAGYFAPIDAKQAQLDAAGITSNPHCLYTAADLHASWNQYIKFMQTKETMLAEKIEHDRLRGLTEEQWKTIEDTFKRYDKDNNGTLEAKEFKDVLFSLGESKDDNEVANLMTQYGDGKKVSKKGFEDFMISILGNVKNQGAIEESFRILTNGQPLATLEALNEMFTEEEVNYIKTKAPRREDGQLDWRAWVEKEYS